MKTFVQIFAIASAAVFVSDAVYWFTAHVEPAGVALLSVLVIALAWIAVYAVTAERGAHLGGDDPGATQQQYAGEDVGIYTTKTPLPVLCAICVLFLLMGAVWSPLIGLLALICLLLCLWRLGRESSHR